MDRKVIGIAAGVAGIIGAAVAAGCGVTSSGGCADKDTCEPGDAAPDQTSLEASTRDAGDGSVGDASLGDGSSDGNASDVSSDGGGDAGEGGVCDPALSPHASGCVVDLGSVFVAPASSGGSDTQGDGGRGAPFATIQHALTHVSGAARLYVCASSYAESVSITSVRVTCWSVLMALITATSKCSFLFGAHFIRLSAAAKRSCGTRSRR